MSSEVRRMGRPSHHRTQSVRSFAQIPRSLFARPHLCPPKKHDFFKFVVLCS